MSLIYLDFDSAPPRKLVPFVTECCKYWGWPLTGIRYDRTRRGYHVVVRVRRRVPPPMILAAQAIFGSDPRREMHNCLRVQNLHRVPKFWRSRWNCLYEGHSRGLKFAAVKKRNTGAA